MTEVGGGSVIMGMWMDAEKGKRSSEKRKQGEREIKKIRASVRDC